MPRASCLLLALTSACVFARPPPPVPSPQIRSDGTVTLVLKAPHAQEVLVRGDFLKPNEKRPLSRSEDGTFSIALGPLAPDIYTYSFEVDGVKTLDPANAWIKSGHFFDSKFEISDGNAYFDPRDVPHGTLHVHSYRSTVANAPRQVTIYTPPAYDPKRTYPVLYLLHGYGDDHTAWPLEGRVDVILDNLLAAGQATPMIVVMPTVHVIPYGGDALKNYDALPQELERHVIPLVEQTYAVAKTREQRALAGLSMGAGLSLVLGMSRPDYYGAILSYSASIYSRMVDAAGDGTALKQHPPLIVLACGADDPLLEGNRRLAQRLGELGVQARMLETPGAHTWRVWRDDLQRTLPLLFKAP